MALKRGDITLTRALLWNADGIHSQQHELENYLRRNKIDVAFICETKLKQEHTFKLKGYNIFRNDRIARPGGGTAILLKKKTPSMLFRDEPMIWFSRISSSCVVS